MLSKNNWIQTNIKDRLINKTVDLQLSLNLYPFYDMSFDEATDYTCNEIYKEHKNLYLALSGGLDSEYVLKAFHRNNIPIQPIIVCCGNEKENEYAYNLCAKLHITPIIINVNERSFLEYYLEYIYKNNCVGYNSTQTLFALKYANDNDGILIKGQHFLFEDQRQITDNEYASINEWDFYEDFISNQYINFFSYTQELAYSMAPRHYMPWNKYRCLIYNISYRNKIKAKYSKELSLILQKLCLASCAKTGIIWTKQEFFDIFEKYNIGAINGKGDNNSYTK